MKTNFKRFLAFVLTMVMVFAYIPAGAFATEGAAPARPTATVSEIKNGELTFAMNFKADEVTEEQLSFYGDWYADFELTVNKDVTFNANGGADGYLSGQYDAWSENWVNVPFENVTLKADETLKIMGYASELMGKTGLKLTYNDVYTSVKNFDCGVFFEPAFLEANPDLKVTLELRMYNPENESESYTVGTTYVFEVAKDQPAAPTATVTEVSNDELTFAMNFKADEATAEQLAYYGDWYADFELTVNKKVVFNANGGADGYLSGQYDAWSENWVNVPFENVTLEANKPLKIMEYASELMGESGLKLTYNDVYTAVKDFDCGVFFEPAFLAANPDLKVTLELKMYDPEDASKSYVIGESYIFENTDFVAKNVETGKIYSDVSKALEEAASNQTVILLKDAKDWIVTVLENTTFDLNGYKLTADYMACFGNVVDNSDANSGRLIVDAKRFLIQEKNAQLPVKTGESYLFAEVEIQDADLEGKYVFQPFVEAAAHEALKAGKDASGVSVEVQISWKKADGTRHQNFVFSDAYLKGVLESYKPATGKYEKMFRLGLTGGEDLDDLYFQAMLCSNTSVAISAQGITRNESEKPEEGGKTTETTAEQTLTTGDNSAVVPEGTKVEEGTDLALTVTEMTEGESNIEVGEGESKKSVDIHVTGVAADNEKPILVTLPAFAELGLNEGNLKLYHVENNEPNTMTRVWNLADVDAHNEFFYNPATGDVSMALKSFSEVAMVAEDEKAWKGGFDYSWYIGQSSPYEIFNADQLAAFGAIVDGTAKDEKDNVIAQDSFAGKTIMLCNDINLSGDGNGKGICFKPIGTGYDDAHAFMGTFDGNGCTITGLHQNGWELNEKYNTEAYTYSTAGGGLFAYAKNATFKNLTLDKAYVVMECIDMGTLVGYAYGECHFENIFVSNSIIANYNRYTGGVVGEVGGGVDNDGDEFTHTFVNVDVDASTTISALWGTFDPGVGGIIGGKYGTATVYMKGCDVACELDVFNDVTSAYRWYSYRRCGMLIGHIEDATRTLNGRTEAYADFLTTRDCTVTYGKWANYTYCEFTEGGAQRYPFVRAEAGLFNEAYSNPRYGHPKDADNKPVVDDNHKHADGESHDVTIVFNQLYGGGQGVYGGNAHAEAGMGVTIFKTGEFEGEYPVAPAYKEKFKANDANITVEAGHPYTLSDLFEATGEGEDIQSFYVHAFVTPVDENSEARGTYAKADNSDKWEDHTITFTGSGIVRITISDYYFCTPTTIYVSVGTRQPVEKFETKFTGDFLYRVGNVGTVSLGTLFEAKAEITGNVSVTVEPLNGTAASGTYIADTNDWTKGTLTFSGTGVVKVTITDNDYCTPTELILEVVDAWNATGATSAPYTDGNGKKHNVVLLNDIGSGFTVSGDYTFYGNGFTLNYTNDGRYLNNGLKHGLIEVSENGTLDNLRIKATIYPKAYLYHSYTMFGDYVQAGPYEEATNSNGDTIYRYYYQLSAVAAKGNATISNCYIYGGRTNIFVDTGDVTISDTVLECGTVANVQIQSTSEYTVTFNNVTTIQQQVNATIADTSRVMLGAGVLVGPDTTSNPTIVLNGRFKQYNWVNEDDADKVSDKKITKGIITGALNATDYNHTINGKTSSNLGIIYMNREDAKVTNNTGLPYVISDMEMTIEGAGGNSAEGQVYSLKGATADQICSDIVNADRNTAQGDYMPTFVFDLGDQEISYDGEDDTRYLYKDNNGVVQALYQNGDDGITLDLSRMATASKHGIKLNVAAVIKDADGNTLAENGNVTLNQSGKYVLEFKVADTVFFDKNGNRIEKTVTRTYTQSLVLTVKERNRENAKINVTKTALDGAYVTVNVTDYKLRFNFLEAITVTDYDENNKGSTVDLSSGIKSAVLSPDSVNVFTTASTATITYNDGRVLTVNFSKISGSSPGTKTAIINTSGSVYFITEGALNNQPTEDSSQNKCTITSWSYKGNNGTTVKDETDVAVTWKLASSSGGQGTCLAEGTLITLADGSQVRVDSLTGNEELLVWNMIEGKLDSAPILFLDSDPESEFEVVHLYFSDGTDVKVIYEHGFWDYDLNEYVYLDANAADYIGHTFAKQNGDELAKVLLADVVIETEVTTAWSPVTAGHLCYFVNGMLSMPGGVGGLFNIFEVDPETMTYDPEAMQRDIETYGLFTYEEMNEIVPLPLEMFETCGGAYLKISIGKGNMTIDDLIYMVNRYRNFFA